MAVKDDPILDARLGQSKGLMPGRDVIPVVFDRTVAEARAILSASVGTVNIVTAAGKLREGVPIQAGITPIRVTQVSTGGTIAESDLWLLVH